MYFIIPEQIQIIKHHVLVKLQLSSCQSIQACVVGVQKNRLNETLLLVTTIYDSVEKHEDWLSYSSGGLDFEISAIGRPVPRYLCQGNLLHKMPHTEWKHKTNTLTTVEAV